MSAEEFLREIRISKYKGDDPSKVVRGLFEEVKMNTHYLNGKCWDILVELLALHVVEHGDLKNLKVGVLKPFHGLTERYRDLYRKIEKHTGFIEHYYMAAKEQPWDYIGDLYQEIGLTGAGQNMTPKNVVDFMVKISYGEAWKFEAKELAYHSYMDYLMRYSMFYNCPPFHIEPVEYPLKTQLDPAVGTGRFLFEASLLYPDAPLVLFGIEINLSLYRACLVNMAMYSNHPVSIICGNTLRLNPDRTGPSSPLWDLGNRWKPPDVSPFYGGSSKRLKQIAVDDPVQTTL